MPWTVIEWFEQTLTPQMSVFEWGSGGSSIFIAQRVRKVISVEYDVIHFFVLWIHTKLRRIANIDYVLVLPENGKANSIYASTHAKHVGEDYEKYCKTIERFPDNSFDMISIDGRARAGCIHLARKKVKVGGYILVDDSEIKSSRNFWSIEASRTRSAFDSNTFVCSFLKNVKTDEC